MASSRVDVSFDKVVKLIEREPVVAGMTRMQPEMRELVGRLLARFAERRADPLAIREEGAALALWGTTKPIPFLEWHRAVGGLARVLEVMLAAIAFEPVAYEWDNSVWALRTARPSRGLSSLGAAPWLWLRTELDAADPAERAAARAIADRALRAWLVRAALAFVFPDDAELWTAVEAAELRQIDVDDPANVMFGLLVAMRGAALDHKRIEKEWNIATAIPPAAILAALGDRAVPALRLIRAFPELARHPDPDALCALAEFADVAWDELASVKPSKAALAALAPLFTTQRPRRTLGVELARGLFAELVVAAPDDAKQLARGATHDAKYVASVIADTGVLLPADARWRSPWVAKAAPKSKRARIVARLDHPETIHWRPDERETIANDGSDRRSAKGDREQTAELSNKAKTETRFMLELRWMTDAPALRAWKTIGPKLWYGQVDDVEHLLARFGVAELDSILAFVQAKPDTLAALARVESARVAPIMARAFALLKKQCDVGRAWLDRFPEAAAIGLLRDAGDKKQRSANDQALAYLANHHRAVVDKVLARAGGGASAAELASAAAPTLPAKPPKLPAFVDVARLPRPIRRDGSAALSGAALIELVQALATTLRDADPAIDAITEPYTDASLARFAWSLFRQWLFVKAPPKAKWALYAVGKFPDDDHARALGRLARVWAPQGNPSRAQEAVETLGMMRTQTALLEIYDIARKVQSKALKARAERVFETVAESMGLAREELADRLVPELSEQDLTFGDQRVELDASLTPRLAGAGELGPDDAKRWKELKRTCSAVARGQIKRLEQAMVDGHRMPFSHFAEIYLMHSLIRNLSSSLLWCADRLLFAVDDGAAVDVRGKPIELPIDARYGVVHPADLSARERAAWAPRFAEQPFEQLARDVFPAADAADCERKLAWLHGRAVATTALLSLQSRGWTRGESPQGGRYDAIERAGDGWRAELMFAPGIYLGGPTAEPTQSIERFVIRADAAPGAAILSELQRDLTRLVPR